VDPLSRTAKTPDSHNLFIADLDGTLLDPSARLSDFARKAVMRLLAAGVSFTVASARSVQSMRPILGDLPLRLPVVGLNGAFLSDLRTGRHERVAAIAPSALPRLLRAADSLGLQPFVTSYDGARDNLYIPAPDNDGIGWYLHDRRSAANPRLRVLFISGYMEAAEVRRSIQARGTAFLQKPFASPELARAVRSALANPV